MDDRDTLKKEQYKFTDIYIIISVFISRILKNVSFLNYCWKKTAGILDKILYGKKWSRYKIIPMGNYCLPRVITTLNKLKPSKINGEKTLPFDLAFFINIKQSVYLVKTRFEDVFDEITYSEKDNCWVNKKYSIKFVHDSKLSLDELKSLYKKRIENLYEYINDTTKHIYFLIALFEIFDINVLEEFVLFLKELRPDNEFDIIVINQSVKEITVNNSHIHIINMCNDTFFKECNKDGSWASQLKSFKSDKARFFYKTITNELRNIIK